MTEQELEKLREKLGPEYSVKRQNGAITVELVDIWRGVEFVECFDDSDIGYDVTVGKIYKCFIVDSELHLIDDKGEADGFIRYSENFKPSTESAYVEQLKAKAKELYGEIKDGMEFDVKDLGYDGIYLTKFPISISSSPSWFYDKRVDALYIGSFPIYQQGKWAKKVEEPIRVNVYSLHYSREPIEYMGELIPSDTIDCTAHFTIDGSSPKVILKDDFRKLLAKCLEDYLNKSQ